MVKFVEKKPLTPVEVAKRKHEISILDKEFMAAKIKMNAAMYNLRLDEKGVIPMKSVVKTSYDDAFYVVLPYDDKTIAFYGSSAWLKGLKILKAGNLAKRPTDIMVVREIYGYYDEKENVVWWEYPKNKPDDLDAHYIVVDSKGVEHNTYCRLADDDSVTKSVAGFPHIPDAKYFRKQRNLLKGKKNG